jgi:hypothetical protein
MGATHKSGCRTQGVGDVADDFEARGPTPQTPLPASGRDFDRSRRGRGERGELPCYPYPGRRSLLSLCPGLPSPTPSGPKTGSPQGFQAPPVSSTKDVGHAQLIQGGDLSQRTVYLCRSAITARYRTGSNRMIWVPKGRTSIFWSETNRPLRSSLPVSGVPRERIWMECSLPVWLTM